MKPLILELRLDCGRAGQARGLRRSPVINPPWTFEEAMREALPWIAERLGDGVTAAVSGPPASAPAPASSA